MSFAKAIDFGPQAGQPLSPESVICLASPSSEDVTKRSMFDASNAFGLLPVRAANTTRLPSGEKLHPSSGSPW